MPRQAATDTPHVSVIVLVYNEIDSVEPLHRELIGVLEALGTSFEVLYIDDGSRDGSTDKLGQLASRDARVRVVSFRRNFGQTAAVQAGIDYSRGAVLVFLDGDLQNDPHDIPHLLEKIDEGYDVVSGWRRDRHDDATRVIPSKVANWVIGRVTGVSLSDFGCTLKAYRREVIQDVSLYGEMHRFLPVLAAWVGGRVCELEVRHHPRTRGTSKYGLTRTYKVLVDLITLKFISGFSTRPNYVFGGFGLANLALGFLAFDVVAYRVLVLRHYEATPLVFVMMLLLIPGTLSLFIGFLAEIVIRGFYDTPRKPTYYVRQP